MMANLLLLNQTHMRLYFQILVSNYTQCCTVIHIKLSVLYRFFVYRADIAGVWYKVGEVGEHNGGCVGEINKD